MVGEQWPFNSNPVAAEIACLQGAVAGIPDRIAELCAAAPFGTKEKVSFKAAYGNERVAAYMFVPKNLKPPYRAVGYYPQSGAEEARSSENLDIRYIDFIVRSGRAVLFPIYEGTYERHVEVDDSEESSGWRDLTIQQSKDFFRSVDYLESRTDIDRDKIGFFGISWGASTAPRLLPWRSG